MHRAISRSWLTKTTIFAGKAVRRSRQGLRDGILDVTGLTAFVIAAFHIPGAAGSVVGWAAIGVACFVLCGGLTDGQSS